MVRNMIAVAVVASFLIGVALVLWSMGGPAAQGNRAAPLQVATADLAAVDIPAQLTARPTEPPTAPTAVPTAAPEPTESPTQLPTPEPTPVVPVSAKTAEELQQLIDNAIAFAPSQVPGLSATIAVAVDGQRFQAGPSERVIAASMAKSWWVLAAVDAVGVEAVEPHVRAVFVESDNIAAGRIIDLIGIDGVNAWTRDHGMDNTYLASWSWGERVRRASDRGQVGTGNQTSAADAAHVLAQLVEGQLFDDETTQTVLEWMRLGPDSRRFDEDWGAAFAASLAPEVAALAGHKAGWLPPNCCAVPTNQVASVGTVPLPDGTPLVIAITAAGGLPYTDQVDWLGRVVADVYAHLSTAGLPAISS